MADSIAKVEDRNDGKQERGNPKPCGVNRAKSAITTLTSNGDRSRKDH